MSGDPADGFEPAERTRHEIGCGWRGREWRQRHAEHGSLFLKTANPELPTLIRRMAPCPAASAAAASIRPLNRCATRNSAITEMLKRSHARANSGNKETVRLQQRHR